MYPESWTRSEWESKPIFKDPGRTMDYNPCKLCFFLFSASALSTAQGMVSWQCTCRHHDSWVPNIPGTWLLNRLFEFKTHRMDQLFESRNWANRKSRGMLLRIAIIVVEASTITGRLLIYWWFKILMQAMAALATLVTAVSPSIKPPVSSWLQFQHTYN